MTTLIGVCAQVDVHTTQFLLNMRSGSSQSSLKGCGGMSCGQRAKLSILLAVCTGVWSDSSQRLWRRCPGRWRSRTESRQSRNQGQTWCVDRECFVRMRARHVDHKKITCTLSHTHVLRMWKATTQHYEELQTEKGWQGTEKNVRAVRCFVHTSRRSQGNFFFVKRISCVKRCYIKNLKEKRR